MPFSPATESDDNLTVIPECDMSEAELLVELPRPDRPNTVGYHRFGTAKTVFSLCRNGSALRDDMVVGQDEAVLAYKEAVPGLGRETNERYGHLVRANCLYLGLGNGQVARRCGSGRAEASPLLDLSRRKRAYRALRRDSGKGRKGARSPDVQALHRHNETPKLSQIEPAEPMWGEKETERGELRRFAKALSRDGRRPAPAFACSGSANG